MRADLRHLARSVRRSPAPAAAAIVTLALTLGAGASIFAVVDAVLLTPPPFADPDALVALGETLPEEPGASPRAVSYARFQAWREHAESLAVLEAFDGTNLTLTETGAAERISATNVTAGFLTLLGAAPALGRTFDADDVGRPVVVISHSFWRDKLGADPGVIGRTVVLGSLPHTIVGVLPEAFFFALNPCDVWRPFPAAPAQERADDRVHVVARLAGNVTPIHLESALDDVSRAASPPARVLGRRLSTAIAGGATRTLGLLAAAAAFAIVIAFTNLAGLLILRSIDRRRELAVRSALGARRSEIARQLLLEAETLVALGAAGGVVLAWWMTPVVGRLALEQFGGIANRDVAVSWHVVLGISILAAVCAAVCGWLPASVASRRSVADVLRRTLTPPARELIVRRILVTAEIALACVLLVCVMLLAGSLRRVLDVNPGFDARDVLTLQVSLAAADYPDAGRVASFYSALQNALEARLGPRTVSIVNEIPLTGDGGRRVVGVARGDADAEAVLREPGSAYFDVMRIPLVAGRTFDARDDSTAAPRAVLSQALAATLFAFEQPIGRHIRLAPTAPVAEIVGVVGDVKHRALDERPVPTVYVSALQSPSHSSIVVARSARPDADVIGAVREEVARLDRNVPVYRTRSMREVIAASPGVPARRVLTATFVGFAVLAVVLGGIGLFGVVAHDVARRRTELALRIALGADPMRILRAAAGQAALMVGAGLAVGGVLSFWAARVLGAVLFETDRLEAASLGAAAAVLVLAGAGAVLPPAWRAARTDPVIALRTE